MARAGYQGDYSMSTLMNWKKERWEEFSRGQGLQEVAGGAGLAHRGLQEGLQEAAGGGGIGSGRQHQLATHCLSGASSE